MAGVPLSESTMWERCEATADATLKVYLLLLRQAAAGGVIYTDDTRVRILSCLNEDRLEKGRATKTSGIVLQVGERKIALYLCGRRYTGENRAKLLKLLSEESHCTRRIRHYTEKIRPNRDKNIEKNAEFSPSIRHYGDFG